MEDNRMGKGQEQGGLQQRAQRVQRERFARRWSLQETH